MRPRPEICLRGRPRRSSAAHSGARCRTGGFTLFEVLVAVVILAIAGLAILQAFALAARMTLRTELELALLLCAQERVAQARLGSSEMGTTRGEMVQGPFTLFWEQRLAAGPVAGLRELTVRVCAPAVPEAPLEVVTYLVAGL
jgi:general secretion pathway protein I